jgi:hypothetical protein
MLFWKALVLFVFLMFSMKNALSQQLGVAEVIKLCEKRITQVKELSNLPLEQIHQALSDLDELSIESPEKLKQLSGLDLKEMAPVFASLEGIDLDDAKRRIVAIAKLMYLPIYTNAIEYKKLDSPPGLLSKMQNECIATELEGLKKD